MLWRRPVRRIALMMLALAGCASSAQPGEVDGPKEPAPFETKPWVYQTNPGNELDSSHYKIYTTISSTEIQKSLVQVMEGALQQYQKIAPGVPLTTSPMECYVFGSRQQWVQFTREHTGIDARIYLQINRGGYTVRDWYVAYNVGESAMYSVAAHEGWHQFVSRHFRGRLPPFLEEGIATMFEDIHWQDDLPHWNLAVNRQRVAALRRAVQNNCLYPLPELVTLHAGNVVNQSDNRIEAFYAEDWAFASFLYNGDGGKWRKPMRQLMSDVADGSVFDPSGVHKNSQLPWNPAGVRPMLEHYLGESLETIDADYQKFVHKVAFDDYLSQWN